MPRLELCVALTSTKLGKFIREELNIAIEEVITVLTWIQSESFGTRVAEIQEWTELHSWRYVDFLNNLK